jgi:hypothetical protein
MSIAELESNTSVAILGRLIQAERDDFSPEAAEAILKIQFDPKDKARMHDLLVKNQGGALTEAEQSEMEEYQRAGLFLGVLWAKARRSLNRAGGKAGNGQDP